MTLVIIYSGVHVANLLLQSKPVVNITFFDVDLLTYLTILLTGLIIVISSLIPLLTLSNKKPIDIIKNNKRRMINETFVCHVDVFYNIMFFYGV